VAQLSDVISADVHSSGIMFILQSPPGAMTPVEIPASAYSLGDMSQFMLRPEAPGGCQNPRGGNFPPDEVCYLLSAAFHNPAKPFIFFAVEFAPKTSRLVGSAATYTSIPNEPGVQGRITSLQISDVLVPEPSSFSCFVAVCGGLFLTGFRGRFKGAHAPVELLSILRNQRARQCGHFSRWNRAQI
jgi:hypothetical protein